MIRINGLNKYFNKGRSNEIHVINDTTLEFEDKGMICILGESGSGKTTLLNAVGGLDTFTSGSITIGDITVDKNSPNEMEKLRNSKYGYVFQEHYLLQEHTVAYNILMAMNMYNISDEEKEERLDYVLTAVGLKKFKKRLVSQLSGGQKQRVAIARALVKTPDIIFADEPTGNLDEVNTMRIMSILKKVSKDCLVILVSHEKRIAHFFADRIIYVQDGKVVKDERHESFDTYQYNDDTNLYLKEFEKESYDNSCAQINFYHEGNKAKITMNVVYKNDKFYIQTPQESKVVFLSTASEMQMVDDAKPVVDLEQVEEFDYSLPRLEADKKAKLSFQDINKLAKDNIKMLGKKQLFMILSFIITAILLVITLVDFMTVAFVDKKSIITADSHYINVMGMLSSSSERNQFIKSFQGIYTNYLNNNIDNDVYVDLMADLSFTYKGFEQIQNMQYSFTDFSYVTTEHFKKKDLMYGRMPKNRNEIIVDQWLIDKFYKSDNILKKFLPDTKDFLNLTVTYGVNDLPLKIVGISDRKEPVVFIDKYTGIGMYLQNGSIGSLQQLQALYPGKYDNIKLAQDEVLVSESVSKSESNSMCSVYFSQKENTYMYIAPNNYRYKVVGTYPDKFGVDSVIDNQYYGDYLSKTILMFQNFNIFSYQNKQKTILNYFAKNKAGFENANVKIIVGNTYRQELAAYKKAAENYLNARFVITIVIFVISLLMLFFTMKSNAINRIQEISVYRLMGITKKSILTAFALEIIMVTSYTVLPVVLILSGIIKFIAGIPSLQQHIVYPWPAAVLLIVFLYAVNIIIGILPVYSIVKLPPAQMVEKI